jgi:predicted Zn finger-like uncharacterized protein
MTVSCPNCETRYRLPPRSKLGAHPTFRCTRCDHVFDPDGEAEAPSVDEEAEDEPTAVDDEEERFTLEAEDDDEPEIDLPPPPPKKKAKRGRAAKVRVEPAVEPDEDDEVEEEDDVAEDDARPERPPPSAARFALRAMLAVTLGYALLSVYFYTHPSRVGELLGSVPVIGQQLAEARLNPASIQLTDVRGEYQRVKGDLLVFVVTGVAINNAPVPVSGIQIQGRISGKEDLRQVVFCGAAPRDVRDLTAREIDLLQTLTPPKDWMLAPGQSGHFLVAFVTPPVPLREFSAEVVAVRRGARLLAGSNGRPATATDVASGPASDG